MTPSTQEHDFSGSVEQRIERLIFYATRHGMLMTQFGESIHDVRQRLHTLEEDRNRRLVDDARTEERELALKRELEELKNAVKDMQGVVKKAAGIILAAVLLAIVKWVLTGNLSGVV